MKEEGSVEVKTPLVSLRAAGKDFLSISAAMGLGVLTAIAFMVYAHAQDSKNANAELVRALRELTVAAREQNCLLSLPQNERDRDTCRRLSRAP